VSSLQAGAILTSIREVIEDGSGLVRDITAGTYEGGISSVTNGAALGSLSLSTPRVESKITNVSPHPASPPIGGTLILRSLSVTVRIVRGFSGRHELNDTHRDALQGLVVADADVIAQALTWPGNLTATNAAAPTGLVSGCLVYSSSSVGSVEIDDANDGRIVSSHLFTGVARITAAVT